MNVIKVLLLFVFLSFSAAILAQNPEEVSLYGPGKLKRFGNSAFREGDYHSAVFYYEYYRKMRPKNMKVAYKLAQSYQQVRNYKKAEETFDEVYLLEPDKFIVALLHSGQMTKTLGDYEKAKEKLSKFKKQYKGLDKSLKKVAQFELETCDSIKSMLARPVKMQVNHLDSTINFPHMEMSPLPLDNEKFVFASLRINEKKYIKSNDTNDIPYRKFYLASKKQDGWQFEGEWQEGPKDNEMNLGNGAYSPDKNRFYFTKCQTNWKNQTICAIYVMEKKDGQWSEPVKMDKHINNPEFTSTMPAVGFDPAKGEILYFVSNRPGGKGGMDIYYSVYNKKTKTFKEPKNAGNGINTGADDITPYFDAPTGTFYFSSNGRGGFGGLDVFKCKSDGGRFSTAENLGAPLNTGADEVYFSLMPNGIEGFVISNRKGGYSFKYENCCDDIYAFRYTDFFRINLRGKVHIQDSLKDRLLANASVELYMVDDKTKELIYLQKVDTKADGSYEFSLEPGYEYEVRAGKKDFLSSGTPISTKNSHKNDSLKQEMYIKKIPPKPIVLIGLHYATNKYELLPESQVLLDTTLLKILKDNPHIIVEISSHTDNQGSDKSNQVLSQNRAKGVVDYLIQKGIPKERMVAKGYGETKPIATNDTDEGRAQNRRTDFSIIGELVQEEE